MFGLIAMSCVIFMVEVFHGFGFYISSMDVIILLFVDSSLFSMLILLFVMLCVMSLIPVSIHMFSLLVWMLVPLIHVLLCCIIFH